MSDPKAIDMWAPMVPTPDVMRHLADNFADQMLGYIRIFRKQEATKEGLRAGILSVQIPEESVLAALDDAGIARSLVTGFDEKTSVGKTMFSNELAAQLSERHPGRFIPFAGVDVLTGMKGVRGLEYWVRERGFRGLSLRPFMIGLPADERRYYPFYAKCVELNIPVSVHTSANWSTERVNDLGHPRHIDPVAADFPELKIIMSHAGYPWVLEAVLLAWKYPGVYLELAAHRPRYFAAPGTGWEPLMRFGQTTIQDKVLFGTGWFLMGKPPAQITEEFRALPVKPAILEKWLHGNAEALLGTG